MKLRIVSAAVAALVGMSACSGPQDPKMEMTGQELGPNLKGPRKGVFLRASFDDDPTHFIGRFLANDLAEEAIDENRGIQTECSKFVTYKDVKAAGNFDEYYNSSTEVSANLGIETEAAKLVEGAGEGAGNFGRQSGTSIRVQYDLTRKLVAHVEDPSGFEACCNSGPGNCTDRYIGEFWYGKGSIFEKSGAATNADAQASVAQGSGGFEVADGWVWRRGTKFDEVFFAFRVTDRKITDDCAWVNELPKSNDGQFFVGVSPPSATEDIARSMSMRHARTQAVQYLGETISSQTFSSSNVVAGYVANDNVVMTAAEGLASFVKDDRYCAVEVQDHPEGLKYVTRVLAFFPNEKKAEATVATIDTVEKQMEADGKLTPEVKKDLAKLRLNAGK